MSYNTTRAVKPGGRVFADLVGGKPVQSRGGKKCMTVVRDDYSKFNKVHFFRSKDDTTENSMKYLVDITLRKVEMGRSDGGGGVRGRVWYPVYSNED